MKKLLFILLYSFIIISFMISCNSPKNIVYSGGVQPKNSYNISIDTLNERQLDSMIVADNLPKYKKWNKTYVKEEETNIAVEYAILFDKYSYIIYTSKLLDRSNHIYVIQKRSIK